MVGFALYLAYGLWKLGALGDNFLRIPALVMFTMLSLFVWAAIAILIDLGQKTSVWVDVILVAAPALALLFHHLLKSPSGAGRALLDEIEGYRSFLKSVEADQLQRLNTPAAAPNLADKHLAYAVALDVEHAWAFKFSRVLDAAGQAMPAALAGSSDSPALPEPAASISGFTDSVSQILIRKSARRGSAP